MQLLYHRQPKNTITLKLLHNIVKKFNEENGIDEEVLPTMEILKEGRGWLIVKAIRWHGGFAGVREKLGMRLEKKRMKEKKEGHRDAYNRSASDEEEHKVFKESESRNTKASESGYCKEGAMQSSDFQSHQNDNSATIKTNKISSTSHSRSNEYPYGYFTLLQNVKHELQTYMLYPKVMPSKSHLPPVLQTAIKNNGGFKKFSYQFDWILYREYKRMVEFYHTAVDLKSYIDTYYESRKAGNNGELLEFPRLVDMEKRGYIDLSKRIVKYGGARVFGVRLGFAYRGADKLSCLNMGEFSLDFAVEMLKYALEKQVAVCGCVGFPRVKEIREDGRNDLVNGVEKHGGEYHVAVRLGLIPQDSEKIKRFLLDQ